MITIEEIARACGKAKKTANGYQCCCPAHPDSTPSLSLSEADDGTILWHDKGGCSQDAVRAAIEGLGFKLNGAKFASIPETKIFYVYEKEKGKPYQRTVKLLPSKRMWLERYENGAWVKGLDGKPRVLYHLHELRAAILAGKRVAITEGEKDADRITKDTNGEVLGTTNMAGAESWEDSYTKEFTGADVTIFYDNDKPKDNGKRTGFERKEKLVAALKPVARKLTVVHLPADYKDISEFWDADQQLDESMYEVIHIPSLADIAKRANQWIEELEADSDPIIEGAYEPGDKFTIIGKSKMRKSFFGLQMVCCIATGRPFLGMQIPKPRKVLLVQYEIKESNFHKRLLRMCNVLQITAADLADNLTIINARGREIDDSKIIAFAQREKFEVILFDPLYKMMEGDESDVSDLKVGLNRLDKIAEATGAAVGIVHHDKKGSVADIDRGDRGSGSGLLGRDLDASFMLAAHKDPELVALEFLFRNSAPREGQSIKWDSGCFVESDSPMQVKTPASAKSDRNKTVLQDWVEPAISILKEEGGEMQVNQLIRQMRDIGASKEMAYDVKDFLVLEGKAAFEDKIINSGKKGRPVRVIKLIG